MAKLEIALAAAVGGLLSLSVGLAAAAETRQPPACSAIAFRPLPSGLTDGVQNAGLYHSRFGRMEVKANVKNGTPEGYFVEIDGKPPTKVAAQNLPADVTACAKLKRMGAPAKGEDPCSGDRLTVLTSHSGDKRYYLLYAHEGRGAEAWHFCSAGSS
ncbi:MAG TPA: hypothetical protein VLV50_20610 [Stellaceae bacterium]|nr:hypothetical protein [Stellaceae bacterium]